MNAHHSNQISETTSRLAAACLAAAVLTASASATLYHVEQDVSLYGNLCQYDVPGGAVYCGPVAAVNSLVFLQKTYSFLPGYGCYTTPLLKPATTDQDGDGEITLYDDMIVTASTLAGPAFMNTSTTGTPPGTSHDYFIFGKHKYVESRDPGVTEYHAEDSWPWSSSLTTPPWVVKTNPTWQFLYFMLCEDKDIEVLISKHGDEHGIGHYITITGFYFNDDSGDMYIDHSDYLQGKASVKFIDPEDGKTHSAGIYQSSGQLWIDYYPSDNAWISMAMAAAPPRLTAVLLDDMQIDQYSGGGDGSSEYMQVRNGDGYGGFDQWRIDAMVKFDVASVPPGTPIVSATLILHYAGYADEWPGGRELTCHRITDEWDEQTTEWPGPDYAPVWTDMAVVPESFGWMQWDVTEDVQAFIDGTAENHGWRIIDGEPWGEVNIPITKFSTKEAGGQWAPHLEIVGELAPCPADVNGDGVVDVLDLILVLAAWGDSGVPEDITGDGVVDVLDLLEILTMWGPCP